MKKTLISALILGVTLSTVSVFAERGGDDASERGNLLRAVPVSMNYENRRGDGSYDDDNYSKNKNKSLYSSSDNGVVKDDVLMPGISDLGAVSPGKEQTQSLWYTSLSRLQARGAQLIRERINSLTANKNVIQANKSLTETQKTALTTILTTNITGLTGLSAAIASSTDASSTKQLISSVYTDYRIYGIVIPQVRLEKRIYDLQNHSVKLSDLFLKVQAKIDEYKAKGKDVTAWQKNLEDAKILVATDMYALTVLRNTVSALKVSDYGTTSVAVIDSANKEIKRISHDFNTIAKNLNKVKTLKARNGTATSTPVVTGTGNATSTATTTSTLPVYTMTQVASHGIQSDCWIVVSGKVYSVSSYITKHPGGQGAIINSCGKDATTAFNTQGGNGSHSPSAKTMLGSFLIGTL